MILKNKKQWRNYKEKYNKIYTAFKYVFIDFEKR